MNSRYNSAVESSILLHFAAPLAKWELDRVAERIHIKFRYPESRRFDDETKKGTPSGETLRDFSCRTRDRSCLHYRGMRSILQDLWLFRLIGEAISQLRPREENREGYSRYAAHEFHYEIAVTWMKLLLTIAVMPNLSINWGFCTTSQACSQFIISHREYEAIFIGRRIL